MFNRPALFTKHRGIALSVAREYFLPGAQPDDVRQEALLALWEATGKHDPERGPFPPFARIVVHRRLQDRVTEARTRKHTVLSEAERDEFHVPGGREPFEILWERMELDRIRRGIPALTANEATALSHALNGRPYAGNKRIDNALQRARLKLREAA